MDIQKKFNEAHMNYRKLSHLGKLASERGNAPLANFLFTISGDYARVAERCDKIMKRRAK